MDIDMIRLQDDRVAHILNQFESREKNGTLSPAADKTKQSFIEVIERGYKDVTKVDLTVSNFSQDNDRLVHNTIKFYKNELRAAGVTPILSKGFPTRLKEEAKLETLQNAAKTLQDKTNQLGGVNFRVGEKGGPQKNITKNARIPHAARESRVGPAKPKLPKNFRRSGP